MSNIKLSLIGVKQWVFKNDLEVSDLFHDGDKIRFFIQPVGSLFVECWQFLWLHATTEHIGPIATVDFDGPMLGNLITDFLSICSP